MGMSHMLFSWWNSEWLLVYRVSRSFVYQPGDIQAFSLAEKPCHETTKDCLHCFQSGAELFCSLRCVLWQRVCPLLIVRDWCFIRPALSRSQPPPLWTPAMRLVLLHQVCNLEDRQRGACLSRNIRIIVPNGPLEETTAHRCRGGLTSCEGSARHLRLSSAKKYPRFLEIGEPVNEGLPGAMFLNDLESMVGCLELIAQSGLAAASCVKDEEQDAQLRVSCFLGELLGGFRVELGLWLRERRNL
jgi:hypothetical protein